MISLFNGKLPAAFAPTVWMTVVGDKIPLTFHLVTSGGPTAVDFYLEFTDDPTLKVPVASREVDEQDIGNGVVTMSKVIRTFQENNGGTLQNGTHDLSCQFVRLAPFARLQIRASAGTAIAKIDCSAGQVPVAP